MGIQNVAKRVLLDELEENFHPEKVEDVIFWALKYYAENYQDQTFGKVIASSIVSRIEEEERNYQQSQN